jgi:hypothetical protein
MFFIIEKCSHQIMNREEQQWRAFDQERKNKLRHLYKYHIKPLWDKTEVFVFSCVNHGNLWLILVGLFFSFFVLALIHALFPSALSCSPGLWLLWPVSSGPT